MRIRYTRKQLLDYAFEDFRLQISPGESMPAFVRDVAIHYFIDDGETTKHGFAHAEAFRQALKDLRDEGHFIYDTALD